MPVPQGPFDDASPSHSCAPQIFVFDATGVTPALPLNRGVDVSQAPRASPCAKRAWREDDPGDREEEEKDSPRRLFFCGPSDEKDDRCSPRTCAPPSFPPSPPAFNRRAAGAWEADRLSGGGHRERLLCAGGALQAPQGTGTWLWGD